MNDECKMCQRLIDAGGNCSGEDGIPCTVFLEPPTKPINTKYFAYIRVSSIDQNTDRQILAIKEYCKTNNIFIEERDIFVDHASGKDFQREKYQALKACLRAGDTVIVKELDRLGRNKDEVKSELEYFKKNSINVRILNIPTTLIDLKEQAWVADMINNILIEVMSAIAQEERLKIKQRQREGIEAAKAKGKHLGRPRAKMPDNFEDVYARWKNGDITAVEAMKTTGLTKNVFYRFANEYDIK